MGIFLENQVYRLEKRVQYLEAMMKELKKHLDLPLLEPKEYRGNKQH